MCDASAQESPLEIQSPMFLLQAGHADPLCLAVFSINTLSKEPRLSQPICWGSVEHPGNPDTIQESLLQTGLSKRSRPAVLTLFLEDSLTQYHLVPRCLLKLCLLTSRLIPIPLRVLSTEPSHHPLFTPMSTLALLKGQVLESPWE